MSQGPGVEALREVEKEKNVCRECGRRWTPGSDGVLRVCVHAPANLRTSLLQRVQARHKEWYWGSRLWEAHHRRHTAEGRGGTRGQGFGDG